MEVFRQICYTTSSSSSASSSSSSSSSLRQGDANLASSAAAPMEMEHMFDKVVTPSDVGKLNRLVIPKQYAERYFPLDPSSADKGVVLCFEDRTGKHWQFRYSYWNSSQSYVITKGWSRFVKDKQLDSGDTVSFSRASPAADNGCRLFIDCHRRQPLLRRRHPSAIPVQQFAAAAARSAARWGGFFPAASLNAVPPSLYNGRIYSYYQSTAPPRPPQERVQNGGGLPFLQEPEPVPVLQNTAEPKRMRLFGVDLEFSDQITPAGSVESNMVSRGDDGDQIPFNEEDGI